MKKSSEYDLIHSITSVICFTLVFNGFGLAFAESKYDFDPSFLNSTDGEVSLAVFNQDAFPAGSYILDIYVNGEYKTTRDVEFSKSKNANNKITPCLDKKLLLLLGVKDSLLKGNNGCNNDNHQRWTLSYNMYEQSLHINVPASDLDKQIDGVAPKTLWDDGITAAFFNYKANASTITSKITNDEQTYAHLELAPGFNFGAWRFRNKTIFTHRGSGYSKWQNINNYVERGIKEIDSRLILGDFITANNLFNNMSIRGVGISTDETMIPGRLRTNTPVIRGVAKTQAYVEVELNGYVIYTSNVDAGVFEIQDLPNVGSNGIYKVTVYEADGTKNVMMVPFTQAPLSLKKGFSEYSISFGRYRGDVSKETGPEILDAGYSYGLNELVTLSAGLQFSNIYEAYAAGVGLSLGAFGALSLEGTYATVKHHYKQKEELQGGAVSLKYLKEFIETGTDLYLANNSYNSKGYRTINEVYESFNSEVFSNANKKNSTSLGLNQSLNDYGGLRLSYNKDRYWDGRKNQYFDISYQGMLDGITYSIGYNGYLNENKKNNHVLTASIQIPFRRANSQTFLTSYKYNDGNPRGGTHSLGISGSGFDNSLSWSVNQKYNRSNHYGASGSAILRHQDGYIGVGASTDRSSSSYSADIGGSMLVSMHGVTFGQEITQSTALLVAEGASNVPVTGKVGVKTNSKGRALITGLQPYRENVLSLDTLETPEDVEILQTDIKVTPTNGAIVEGKLKTNEGHKALVRLVTTSHKNVPFGSVVTLNGNTTGIVGDNGEVFLTGLPESGVIRVKWGADNGKSCFVRFNKLPDKNFKTLTCI